MEGEDNDREHRYDPGGVPGSNILYLLLQGKARELQEKGVEPIFE